ncbi:MAG: stage II sporulation protein E (SpoIIE) [Crocinitomix sp.]|nr:stage II sporulation protein E (SpoIIE) [Crocinitomix sp.]
MQNKNHELNVYTTLQIGNFHTNNCEDFFINEKISTNDYVIAVLDGCTMGKESTFAAMLFGKILRKIAKNKFYAELITKELIPIKQQLKDVLSELFEEAKVIKNRLGLEKEELLSTLILGIVNTTTLNAEFLTVGDGLIYVDGQSSHFEQDDKPDYLGYHLHANFENWYADQMQFLSISSFKDLSICTDGIYTFKNFSNKNKQLSEAEIIAYLLTDKNDIIYPDFLALKIRQLQTELNHILTDDLAIIRLISSVFPPFH